MKTITTITTQINKVDNNNEEEIRKIANQINSSIRIYRNNIIGNRNNIGNVHIINTNTSTSPQNAINNNINQNMIIQPEINNNNRNVQQEQQQNVDLSLIPP